MKRVLRQVIGLAWMRMLPARRNKVAYGFVFLFPMMFLFLFTLIGGKEMTPHVLLGALVAIMVNNAIISLPQIIIEYKYWKLQDVFVASPVHPLVYSLGTGLSRFLYAAPGLTALFTVVLVTGYMPLRAAPVVLTVLLVTWMTSCAIGFTLATYIKNMLQISAYANLLGMMLTVLPPVYYPVELFPAGWRNVVLLIPSASGANLVRAACGMSTFDTTSDLLMCVGALAAYTVIGILLVVYKSRWREV